MKQLFLRIGAAALLCSLLSVTSLCVRTAHAKDYNTIDVGRNQIYKSGKLKIIISDDVSGEKTTGTLTVFRDTAPDWDTMYYQPTTWNCRLEVDDAKNAHRLSCSQTTVTTTKDINGFYQIMNFQLTLTQHAYYTYDSQRHAGSGNGFRLNFESYDQNNSGAGTITDGIVTEDTVRTINWQVNTAALGLRTFHQVRYTGCKSYLDYTRPRHTVTVDPNGGYYRDTTSHTVYNNRTGEWRKLTQTPVRDYYLFRGFIRQGTSYAYRSAGSGETTDLSPGFAQNFSSGGFYTRYRGSDVSDADYIRFRPFSVRKNRRIRITGYIRINSLKSGSAVNLYQKTDPDEIVSPLASFSKADGTWQKFDITRTYQDESSEALLEIRPSGRAATVQFDLRHLTIVNQSTGKRVADTDLQVADGKKADVTLRAQWTPLLYQIRFASDTDLPVGLPDPRTIHQDTSVSLPSCTSVPDNVAFCGWEYNGRRYQAKERVSYMDLVSTPLQERKNDADITPETVEEEDCFTFTAVWNHLPVLTLEPDTAVFTEGEEIPASALSELVKSCTDTEDGDLKDRVSIRKIRYSPSKDGYQPKAQTQIDEDTMLDTYYMHLEKDETVSVSVTYSVTDNDGHTVQETTDIFIRYNYPPEIEAADLSFYVHEIVDSPEQVEQEIRNHAAASDIEDEKKDRKPELILSDPDPLKLSDMQKPGIYSATYRAEDSLKKVTEKTIRIYVFDGDPYAGYKKQNVRFISKSHLHTLDETSIWNTNAACHDYLKASLNKSGSQASHTYVFRTGGASE